MQRGDQVGIDIKRSTRGLGAFANRTIAKGDYIGEYIGELYTIDDVPRDDENRHRGLNYTFGIDVENGYFIDGMRVGNETRYLNHPEKEKSANAEAQILLVNGDQRIGIFASHLTREGKELTLDYGEGYWKGHTNGGDEDT
ncbi:hypothetical protein EW146_g1017 [Bondarzewia mesenterica]|uniref:SET domain-containing protein n=1 Tax=Bondarzewia mesenterica TaxID=1095465 RepID=A0A4S4M559_9AGAM|nr:hypothetical protein EW146_g1017 [Bondarzewia mesenterica]